MMVFLNIAEAKAELSSEEWSSEELSSEEIDNILDDLALRHVINNGGTLELTKGKIGYFKSWIKKGRKGRFEFIGKSYKKGKSTYYTPEQTLLIYERAVEFFTHAD